MNRDSGERIENNDCTQVPYLVRSALIVGAFFASAFLVGCGGGPGSIELTGNVTFKGKPVPHGFISFTSVNQEAGQVVRIVSSVRDGKYVAARNQGITGGQEYHVEVGGFDGPQESEESRVKQLFPLWTTALVTPKEGGELNVEVVP